MTSVTPCDFQPGYLEPSTELPFLTAFEAAFEAVEEAFAFVSGNDMLVELPGVGNKSVQAGHWDLFPLYVNCNYDFYLDFLSYKVGVDVRQVQAVLRQNLPRFFSVLDQQAATGRVINATFYRMKPGTTLRLHADSGDFQYRAHMGLRIPPGNCALRVKDTVSKWTPGKFMVFDSTQPHMAWNLTEEERVVFSIDFFREPLEANQSLHIAEVKRRMASTPLGFEGGGYLELADQTMKRFNHVVQIAQP